MELFPINTWTDEKLPLLQNNGVVCLGGRDEAMGVEQ